MKNTTVRAFSLSSESERIIDEYANSRMIKSKSKALDSLIKEYALVSQYCDKCRTKRQLLKEMKEAFKSGKTHADMKTIRKGLYYGND